MKRSNLLPVHTDSMDSGNGGEIRRSFLWMGAYPYSEVMNVGYRITYGQPFEGKQYSQPKGRRRAMTALALAVFLLLTHFFWPEGRAMLRQLLIPGDPDVTAGAFDTLVRQVRAGEAVSDALRAFCQEILYHG